MMKLLMTEVIIINKKFSTRMQHGHGCHTDSREEQAVGNHA
jgi:hypothetical protein